MKDTSITIEVMATETGALLNPIKFDDTEITQLGLYDCNGIKVWVVKKCPPIIKLPNTILPRHADDRENIKDLCVAVNQIIAYLDNRMSEESED